MKKMKKVIVSCVLMLALALGVTDVTAMAKSTDEKTASLCANTKKSKTTKKTKKSKTTKKTKKTKKKSKAKKPENKNRTYKEACAYFESKYNLKDINDMVYNDDGSVTFYYVSKHTDHCSYDATCELSYQKLYNQMSFVMLAEGYPMMTGSGSFVEALNGADGNAQWCLFNTTCKGKGKKKPKYPKKTKEAYDYFASKYPMDELIYNDDGSVSFYCIGDEDDTLYGYDEVGYELLANGYFEVSSNAIPPFEPTVSGISTAIEEFEDTDGNRWSLFYSTMKGSK